MQVNSIITITGNDLPEELQVLPQPPALLNLKGNASLLGSHPRVGIVGARKFTPYGREVTANIASVLGRAGVTVISGLALGVDSIAHKACLDSHGKTIAILPSGIEKIYPASHSQLAKQIVESDGLLASEYPSNYNPQRHDFLRRNRIIAGLSDILVITEAGIASGSLNTARHALDQGITIMAVPGNITSPYSSGTNRLIQAGAIPLLDPQEILTYLGMESENQQEYIPENEIEKLLITNIGTGISGTNDLINTCGVEPSELQTHLTMLEIKGVLGVQGGQWRLL